MCEPYIERSDEIVDVSCDEETVQQEPFIEVSDDIVDASSDEETVQHDDITTRSQVTLHDGLVADEERHDLQGLQDMFIEAVEGTHEPTEFGNVVEATQNFRPSTAQTRPPTAVPFPSPTSTTQEALSFGAHDGKLLRVKMRRPRKNYCTGTPRRSPRLGEKNKGSKKSAEQLAVDRQISRMLYPVEEPAASTSNEESSKTLSTGHAN